MWLDGKRLDKSRQPIMREKSERVKTNRSARVKESDTVYYKEIIWGYCPSSDPN